MVRIIRLGIIVPSSNTALEPLTTAIINSVSDPSFAVSVHYTRIRVTQINLSNDSNAQFDISYFLDAARLLADAGVHCIGWSGTSAGWLGFDRDQHLCSTIEKDLDIPCTTSVQALNRVLEGLGSTSFGLVTPYTIDLNDAIVQNYAKIGVSISHTTALGITENRAIAQVGEEVFDKAIDSVTKEGATLISTFCTNLVAAQRVAHWEQKHDIFVVDTVAVVVWDMLRIAGLRSGSVRGWGKLFEIGEGSVL